MIIEVQLKQVYGRDRIYPINDAAKKFAQLIKKKTFDMSEIKLLSEIGFEIKWVYDFKEPAF